jgi:pimeloyl-ACP methyl ester carboxylesterase
MATMLAFADKPPATTVFIAPALSFDALLRRYADLVGLTHRTEAVLSCRMREFLGGSLRVLESGARQWPGGRLLIVHDPADEDASYALSARLARGTQRVSSTAQVALHTVTGLGHYQPMRDPEVVAVVTAFAGQGSEQVSAA